MMFTAENLATPNLDTAHTVRMCVNGWWTFGCWWSYCTTWCGNVWVQHFISLMFVQRFPLGSNFTDVRWPIEDIFGLKYLISKYIIVTCFKCTWLIEGNVSIFWNRCFIIVIQLTYIFDINYSIREMYISRTGACTVGVTYWYV